MQQQTRYAKLVRTNRRLRYALGTVAATLLLGVGMAMQAGLQKGDHLGGADSVEAALSVNDSSGFAVFVKSDGNLVIVKDDGTVITTQNQPMSISF